MVDRKKLLLIVNIVQRLCCSRCSERVLSPFVPQVNQQRQKLHDLQNLIDNLGSQDTVSDKAFEDRLKEAEKTIMDLLKEAQASKGTAYLRRQHTVSLLYCSA